MIVTGFLLPGNLKEAGPVWRQLKVGCRWEEG